VGHDGPLVAEWVLEPRVAVPIELIFASRVRLDAFEQAFSTLGTPRLGGPPPRLSPETILRLRGVGGLAPSEPARPTPRPSFHTIFTMPLAGRETAEGLWARLLTVNNPSSAGQ
jgi:hypothetical protein